MPRFTEHARRRFQERRLDLFPPGIDPPPTRVIEQMVHRNYAGSAPISRADAEHFLGHRIGVYWGDVFYRLDPDETGIWVVVWLSKGNEEIRTFIVPGEDPEVALHVEGMTGAVSF